jgi:SAM-dependent methyltransferase
MESEATDFAGVTRDWAAEDSTVGNDGERVTVHNGWAYWSHLSIYRFAVPFVVGHRILDVGSGSGYGAAYLAIHGAADVLGLDVGAGAIAHSQRRYQAHRRVRYQVADLNLPLPVGDQSSDVIFSSNVFEHVGNVDGLASECARALTPDGIMIVAVPPLVSPDVLLDDIHNQFHVNHLPPWAWLAKLGRFFEEVECYGHRGLGEFASKERERLEIERSSEDITIRETDFEFPRTSVEGFGSNGWSWSLTAIFVCRRPRPKAYPETLAERTPAAWREGEVAARVLAEERAVSKRLRAELGVLQSRVEQTQAELRAAAAQIAEGDQASARAAAEVTTLKNSRSWRATAPVRALVTLARRRGLI